MFKNSDMAYLILLLLTFSSLNAIAQKTEILIYEQKNKGFQMILADMEHFIGISPDSTWLLLIDKQQKTLDKIQSTRGKIMHIGLIDPSTISLYADEKMKVYSILNGEFTLLKDVKHNTFEVPLQTPLIVGNLIIGFSKVNPPQEGMLAYKYAFRDEHSLRDISVPFPVLNKFKTLEKPHRIYFNDKNKEAYLPLPEASKICIFNFINKKKRFFSFPKHHEETEQWIYIFDQTKASHYAVLQRMDEKNKLYRITENFGGLEFVKYLDFIPKAFIGEYMYVIRKSSNGSFQHVLTPILTHDESKTVMEEYD